MSTIIEKDLQLAQKEIAEGWGTAIARNGVILDREKGRGIRPSLQMARRRGAARECAFADKVLGLAAFRLGRFMGATIMWGEVTSSLAVSEGRRSGIEVRYHILVPSIMNASLDALCPMEHLAFLNRDDRRFFEQVDEMVQ